MKTKKHTTDLDKKFKSKEYQQGYTDGLTFAQGVVDKVFTKKRNHG